MIITLMRVEEHEHALVPEVALSETRLIKAVNLGVGQGVADTLEIDNHHVTLG
jgi:hypothetical protein